MVPVHILNVFFSEPANIKMSTSNEVSNKRPTMTK